MRVRTLLKTSTIAFGVSIALLNEVSVPESPIQASERNPESVQVLNEAARRKSARPVRTSRKQKRSAPVLLAQTAPAVESVKTLPALDDPAITAEHRALAGTVLSSLPSHCRTNLRTFSVLYTNAAYRGLGGKTTIILDGSVPQNEFTSLLIHECGHVTHGNLLGNSRNTASAFRDGNDIFYADSPVVSFFEISWDTENVRRKGSADSDFVSGYAKSDAFEDFAETFAAYVLHRPMLRERARENDAIAKKLRWMETHLPLEEQIIGQSQYQWEEEIPWDITRLPFVSLVK